jgi:hypothetical protein
MMDVVSGPRGSACRDFGVIGFAYRDVLFGDIADSCMSRDIADT